MKQLVVLSGKGGTGKTSLTAAFAHLASQDRYAGRIILADADVDAANLELVLQPRLLDEQDFKGGQVAVIDQDTCASCGDCVAVCRFDAIFPHPPSFSREERGASSYEGDSYYVDPIACDGCAACVYQCPSESISMHGQVVGKFYVSDSRYGPLYHANLFISRPPEEIERCPIQKLVSVISGANKLWPVGANVLGSYGPSALRRARAAQPALAKVASS